ncbi:MAG: LamG domain-containing protein [Spirochaetes bacterium]|nr:LamG domain-containing protein [Spirochaetota bacterium]
MKPRKARAMECRRSPLASMLVFLFLSGAGLFAQDTSTGAVIWWKMNEGSGVTLADSAGSGVSGTLVNTPLWTNGVTGSALYFTSNALRPYVSATFDYGVMRSNEENSNWTVACWFKTSDWPARTSESYLWGRVGSHAGLALNSNAGNISLNYSYRVANGQNSNITLATNVRNGLWYHAAVVFSNRTAFFYLNGTLSGQRAIAVTESCFNFGTSFSLGWIAGGQYGYTGALDEFRVYTRPLSALDVGALAAPSVSFTNLTNQQAIIPGVILRGTCSPGLAYARLYVTNASLIEATNAALSFDSATSWWASPTLALGDYTAVLLVSNSNGQGFASAPVSFTVTTFSSLTVRTLSASGAPVWGGRIFGPGAAYDGLRTNDVNGEAVFANLQVGRLIGLTNFSPLASGLPAVVSNFPMPGADTLIVWTMGAPAAAAIATNEFLATNAAAVVLGRTGSLKLQLAAPGPGSSRLTVTAVRLSGGARVPFFDGFTSGEKVDLEIPLAGVRDRLGAGVWVVESRFRAAGADENRAVARRQLLMLAE